MRLLVCRAGSPQASGLGGRGVDDGIYPGDRVSREAALPGVLTDHLFIGRVVDAINLVTCHVAVNPLDLRAEFAKDTAGGLRDGLKLRGRELSGTGNFAFDYIFGHGGSPIDSM